MNLEERMDPELAAVFRTLPELGDLTADPVAARRAEAERIEEVHRVTPGDDRVTTEDRSIPGPHGAPNVAIRLYQPAARPAILPALLWLHGGGFILGDLDRVDPYCRRTAAQVGCLVVSVDYRLAPEHPFPAAVEDAYAALLWLASAAPQIGVDGRRVAVGGASAGGCLAAAVALMARDRRGPELAFQLLIYPCLDDRHTTASSYAVNDCRTWNRRASLSAWRAYLGDEARGDEAGDDVSPYAAPMRATDLSRLPPAYVLAAELDLLRDEDVAYAGRLMQAGVSTELHVFPGAFHGFDGVAPDAAVSRRARSEIVAVTRRALGR